MSERWVTVPDFMTAMDICERGFQAWAEKEHNRKWVRRIDGTPIKNDLLVNIALAIMNPTLQPKSEERPVNEIAPDPPDSVT
ncbi:MAG TPA: hypothetical protein VNH83_16140 [Bryobacteraceae bacterium]|nr:hypothetical protein [Bryobacteraceae bacterium]